MKKRLCAITLLFALLLSALMLTSCGTGFANMLNDEMRANFVYSKASKKMSSLKYLTTNVTQTIDMTLKDNKTESTIKYHVVEENLSKSKYKCQFELSNEDNTANSGYKYCYDGKTLYEKSGELRLKQEMNIKEFNEFQSVSTSNIFENIDIYSDITMTCDKHNDGKFNLKMEVKDESVLNKIYKGLESSMGSMYNYMFLESFSGECVIDEDFKLISRHMDYKVKSKYNPEDVCNLSLISEFSFDKTGVNPPEDMSEYTETDILIKIEEAIFSVNNFINQAQGKYISDIEVEITRGLYPASQKSHSELKYYKDQDGIFRFDCTFGNKGSSQPSVEMNYDGKTLSTTTGTSTSSAQFSQLEASAYVTSTKAAYITFDKNEYKSISYDSSTYTFTGELSDTYLRDYIKTQMGQLNLKGIKIVRNNKATKKFVFDESGKLLRTETEIDISFETKSDDYTYIFKLNFSGENADFDVPEDGKGNSENEV